MFVLSISLACCTSEPNETEVENPSEQVEVKQIQLPPYSVRLAEVEFTQPLEDLRFYDQILEVRNNRVEVLERNPFPPRHILILIDGTDSLTQRRTISEYLSTEGSGYWYDDFNVHYLVRHNNKLGALSEIHFGGNQLLGCGFRNLFNIQSDSSFALDRVDYNSINVTKVVDSILQSKRYTLVPDTLYKEVVINNYKLNQETDTVSLKRMCSLIQDLSVNNPFHNNNFHLLLASYHPINIENSSSKHSRIHFNARMKFISQIKELEHKKLEVLTNFLNENEEKYGNLSEGELRFLFNKIKIPIRAINYVPPPPPSVAVKEEP